MVQHSGAAAIEFVGDISDENCVTAFAEPVQAKWSRVDLLVNNAGISCIVPAEQTSGSQFRRVFVAMPYVLAGSRPRWTLQTKQAAAIPTKTSWTASLWDDSQHPRT